MTFASHMPRDTGRAKGSRSAKTRNTSSVERRSVAAPPMAISEVEAKKPCHSAACP